MYITKELSVPLSDELISIHDKYFDSLPKNVDCVPLQREMIAAAKDKLTQIITSLLWEKDMAYSYVFPAMPEGYHHDSNILYDLIYRDETRRVRQDAWTYNDLQSGDSDYYGSDYGLGAILYHLGDDLLLVGDLYRMDCLGEYSEKFIKSDEFEEELVDLIRCGYLYEWLHDRYSEDAFSEGEDNINDEFIPEVLRIVRNFLIAFDRASKGEEFDNDIMDALLEDFHSVWGEDIPDSYFLDNFGMFAPALFDGNSDQQYTTLVVTSKDIYKYLRVYRDKLPVEIRNTADSYLKLLTCPFGADGESYAPRMFTYCDDNTKRYILGLMCSDGSCGNSSYDFSYANPFYRTALLWLDRNLPILEAEYGGTQQGASVSVYYFLYVVFTIC